MHDGDLLKEYLTERSEAAFRRLVERYQDVVHSLAWRQLGDPAAAEDVAQQVFLLLASKAHWLTGRSSVGGWLHRSTLNLCARAHTREIRRMKREHTYSADPSINSTEPPPDNRELIRQLDTILNELPEKEREAIVLRFYRGQSLREVGESLGTTEEAARKRVSRALDRLSERLKRKGVTAAAAAVLAAVLTEGAQAAPVGFTARTLSAAAAGGAFGKASLTAAIVTKAALLTKTQLAGVLAVAAAVPIAAQWKQTQDLRAELAALRDQNSSGGKTTVAAASARPAESVPAQPEISVEKSVTGTPAEARPKRDKFDWRRRWDKLSRAQQVEARVVQAASELKLNEAQAAEFSRILTSAGDEKDALYRTAWDAKEPVSSEALADVTARRDAAIAALLTEEQQAAWQNFHAAERQNRIELHVMDSLKEIQRYWRLSESQKDAAWELFTKQAEIFDPELMTDFRDSRTQQDEVLRQVLPPEQLAIFERHRDAQKALWEEEMNTRGTAPGGPPGPPPERK